MSTKLYAYTVKKDKLWEVADTLRKQFPDGKWDDWIETMQTSTTLTQEVIRGHKEIHLQIFELDLDYYIFRVIEEGWAVENFIAKHPELPVSNCFYDDRSDQSPEQEANIRYVNIVDDLVEKRRYFMVPVSEMRW